MLGLARGADETQMICHKPVPGPAVADRLQEETPK
jgi:hypothetical protein